MHAEQDRPMSPDAAFEPPPLDADASGSEAPATIMVMIAASRVGLGATWRSLLANAPGIRLTGGPDVDATSLADRVERDLPGVLLLDKALLDALDAGSLRRLHALRPHVRVLLLWDELCHALVADVWRHRFQGYLLATPLPQDCLKAIRTVCRGELWLSRAALAMAFADLLLPPEDVVAWAHGPPGIDSTEVLTPREVQVVESLRRGCINKEIARELGIREDTVKKHLQSVFAKLGVHRRALVALRRLPGAGAPPAPTHAHRMQARGAIGTTVVPLDRSRAPARSLPGLGPG